jgi:hypothetical protein
MISPTALNPKISKKKKTFVMTKNVDVMGIFIELFL